jgi:Rps23 Pro-64 3,4-dihydroxylase Tpa1-like proline 4-hydroxylase
MNLLAYSFAVSGYIVGVSSFISTPRTNTKTQSYHCKQQQQCLHLTTMTQSTNEDGPTLPSSVYDTIQEGKIAVLPNFIPQTEINPLRTDAQNLWDEGKFSTDALAGYGSTGKFDPTKDRAVLRLPQWKNEALGNYANRQRFGNLMANIRSQLSYNLNRPALDTGLATTMYGKGSTEVSYTRFGPGAFLKRHVDEHHEELKGVDGWSKPTRRSISWLIYLNDSDWDGKKHGGQLRCFERSVKPGGRIGAAANGDLQLGWLKATAVDPYERPVYLDAKKHDHGDCAMYILNNDSGSSINKTYISKTFQTNPIMYVAGSEALTKKILFPDRRDLAERFHLIEPPKSKINDILKGDKAYSGIGENAAIDEELEDVEPRGGTLVLFDSVSLPHEVLATKDRVRWACSGWFHEDQQPPPV